jgi:hypothetical protein
MAALLEKLEAAEMRIGLCEDTKLAKLLELALPNILGFLSSAEPAVRNKVMAILGHINKRVKGDASILLPLGGLAKLFLSTDHPMVSNFALVYVEMAFARVPAAERATLLPKLLVGMAARQVAQQDTLLQLLLLALPTLPLPKVAAELKGLEASLPFLEVAADRSLALRHLLDVLLYLPPCTRGQAEGAPPPAPPGLSHAAAKRVCGKLGPEEVRGELLHGQLTTCFQRSTIYYLLSTTRCAASCSPPRSSPCCGCSAAQSAPARSSRQRRCCPTGSSRAAMPTARWRSTETSSSSGSRRRRCAWACPWADAHHMCMCMCICMCMHACMGTASAPHLRRWTAARRSMCSRASCSAPRRAAASAPPPTPACESRRRRRSAALSQQRAASPARCRRPFTASSAPTPRPSSCRRARSWPGTWPCTAPPRSWSPSPPRSSRGSSRCSATRACPTGCGRSSPRPYRCAPSATAPSRRSARARPRCCARTSRW